MEKFYAISLLLIVLNAAIYGLWRRAYGGWLGMSKTALRWGSVALAWPVVFYSGWLSWPVFGCVWVLYWSKGHEWTSRSRLLYRYGPPGLVYTLLQRFWPERWRCGGFVDGPIAVAELSMGAIIGLVVGLPAVPYIAMVL